MSDLEKLLQNVDLVLREALDKVDVHPCDEHNDNIRASGLVGAMRNLYDARKSMVNVDFYVKNAARYLWFWNNAHNVSFTYQFNQYTKVSSMGLHCGTLQDTIDAAMRNAEKRS